MDPAPDRTAHNAMVYRYKRLQLKHGDLVNDRQRLMDELAATQEVLDRLQAEAETLVELMHPLDPGTVLSPDYVELHAEDDEPVDKDDNGDTLNPYNDPSVPNHREYFLQYHPSNNGMSVTEAQGKLHTAATPSNSVADQTSATNSSGGAEGSVQIAPQPA